jgi:hypothetical protein
MLEHREHLLSRHSRKPRYEVIDRGTIFDVLEQRLDRQTRSTENACPANS